MRTTKILRAVLPFALTVLMYACSSVGYEIEETIDTDAINNTAAQQPAGNQEVQQSTAATENISENSGTETGTTIKSDKIYTIQIGAFSNEAFARNYSVNASELDYDIRFEKENGLCKIRLGRFTSASDAARILETLKNIGYKDSFLLESK